MDSFEEIKRSIMEGQKKIGMKDNAVAQTLILMEMLNLLVESRDILDAMEKNR